MSFFQSEFIPQYQTLTYNYPFSFRLIETLNILERMNLCRVLIWCCVCVCLYILLTLGAPRMANKTIPNWEHNFSDSICRCKDFLAMEAAFAARYRKLPPILQPVGWSRDPTTRRWSEQLSWHRIISCCHAHSSACSFQMEGNCYCSCNVKDYS